MVETKTHGGRLSDAQVREQRRLQDEGYTVVNIWNKDAVDWLEREYL